MLKIPSTIKFVIRVGLVLITVEYFFHDFIITGVEHIAETAGLGTADFLWNFFKGLLAHMGHMF